MYKEQRIKDLPVNGSSYDRRKKFKTQERDIAYDGILPSTVILFMKVKLSLCFN